MNPAPPLQTIADIEHLLEAHADLHALLLHVESLGLPDCWIGAGFIRNTSLGRAARARDRCVPSQRRGCAFLRSERYPTGARKPLNTASRNRFQAATWSVKNQARMHLRNGDAPYRDTFDAVAHWAETATAIAARSLRGKIEVMAPHGIRGSAEPDRATDTGLRTEDGCLSRADLKQGMAGSLAETDDAHDVG